MLSPWRTFARQLSNNFFPVKKMPFLMLVTLVTLSTCQYEKIFHHAVWTLLSFRN